MPVELQGLWHLLQIILLQHVLLAHTCIKKRNVFTNSSIIKKKENGEIHSRKVWVCNETS